MATEAERPVVIDLTSDHATMSWSYGAGSPVPALEEVRRYLPVFERHGYVAWDPQLDRVFDPERDPPHATKIHHYVREQTLAGLGSVSEKPPKAPWWKRLRGRG